MCGIAGFFRFDSRPQLNDERHLLAVRDHMTPRGPDSAGLWLSPDRRVGLANRRLAIQDLSEAGNQPMFSADGNLVVVFNGEIYNYPELRTELEAKGVVFRSHCDTEILLHLYQLEGTSFPVRLRGMFAFSIFDQSRRHLFIVRDHFGQKPLYYSFSNGCIWFASQVRALLKNPEISREPDPAGHVGFFLWGHVPDPATLYAGIRSLPAGSTLLVRTGEAPMSSTWFSVSRAIADQPALQVRTPHDKIERLRKVLDQSVSAHLLADVPVGLFLSAGIDSTVISSLAARRQNHNLRSVTLGFREFIGTPLDETIQAQKTAQTLGIPHQTVWVARQEFFADLDRFFHAMDQPTIDAINVFLVSRVAAQTGLKVALSGLGGDELFGSYPSFRQIPPTVRLLGPLRHLPAVGIGIRKLLAPVLERWVSPKYAGLLELGSTYAGAYFLRRGLFNPWEIAHLGRFDSDFANAGLHALPVVDRPQNATPRLADPYLKVMSLEITRYMRHQLLRDADWAGMAHSLEIRCPLVDIEVFKTVVGLSKGNAVPSKRDFGKTVVQPSQGDLLNRPKSGFMIPVNEWVQAGSSTESFSRGLRAWSQRVYERYVSAA